MNDLGKYGILFLLITVAAECMSLDLSDINMAHQYDVESQLKFEFRVVEDDDHASVLYKIPNDTLGIWKFSILGQKGYNSAAHDTLSLDHLDTLSYNSSGGVYSYSLAKSSHNIVLFTFTNLSLGISRIFDVRVVSPGGFPDFYPVNEAGLPQFKNYTTSDEVNFSTSDSVLHAYRYLDDYGPADPPMGEMTTLAPTLSIDSSIFFRDKLSGLKEYHFYLFQNDTLENNGITLLKCPKYFPELKKFNELIEPMRYITTTKENQALQQASDPRKAFESFWLETYDTKFRAKSAISFFFRRVEEANVLFTDYKQGWKTDRGILYIIYGLPNIVIRTDRTEIWKYASGEEFEFIRFPTLFTPSLYSLRRDSKYEKSWYLKVGEIRKGP